MMVPLQQFFCQSSSNVLSVTSVVLALIVIQVEPTLADSVIPAINGATESVVNVEDNRYTITGGQYSGDGDNLFHELEQFNLNPNEIADFISNTGIDNIVTFINSGNASYLNGLIQVSGGDSNLYLINPAGVLFGETATLNIPASLTVSTADSLGFGDRWLNIFGTNDFSALGGEPGTFVFTAKNSGAILNEADLSLTAGNQLMLIGGTVINAGNLTSSDGAVTVAAIEGEQLVRISQAGNLLSLELAATDDVTALTSGEAVPFDPLSLPALLTGNSAHSSQTTVAADDRLYFDTGASGVSARTGISLVLGEIETTGETGGSITVLGDRIGLLDSSLNASGRNGGGTVRVGGDYQGQGSVFNAERTFVDGTSVITADALVNGDGGQVTVWADSATKFDGSISARGGNQFGNGGRVETSGLAYLDVQGQVDTSSARGQAGSWLLDPTNIEVVASGGTATDLNDVDSFLDADLDANLTTTINTSLLNTARSNVTLQAVNDITFSSDVNIAEVDVGLVANAGNNIDVNADIRTNGGDVVLQSAVGSITAENIETSASGAAINNNNSGNIFLTAEGDISTGTLRTASVEGDAGDVFVQSRFGSISTTAITTAATRVLQNGFSTNAGNAGSVTLLSPLGNIDITSTSGIQSFSLAGSATNDSSVSAGNGGFVNIMSGGAVSLEGQIDTRSQAVVNVPNGQSGRGGDIRVDAVDNLFIDGRLLSLSSARNGPVTTPGSTAGAAGNITLQSNRDIMLRSGSISGTPDSINAISPVLPGNVLIESGRDITFLGEDRRTNSGNSIRVGELTFRAGGGINLDLGVPNASISTTGQNVTFSANNNIRLQNTLIQTVQVAPLNPSAGLGNVALLSEQGGVFIDGPISTASAVGNSGTVTIQAETEIRADTIFTSSAIANAGNVLLDPIGDIEVAWINATAPNGVGGNVDITAGRFFRATDSFTDFNGTTASIATSGQLDNGTITLRHGGSGFTPFTVGDAELNGTQSAITAGTGNTIQPVQEILESFGQGNIQIVTAPRQDPLANIEEEVSPEADLDDYLEESNDIQEPEVSTPTVIVFNTLDEIKTVETKVNDIDKSFQQQHEAYYSSGSSSNASSSSLDSSNASGSSLDDSNASSSSLDSSSSSSSSGSGSSGIARTQPTIPDSSSNNDGQSDNGADNDTSESSSDTTIPPSESETVDTNIIAISNRAIREVEAASNETKPAIVHAFFSPSDQTVAGEELSEGLDNDGVDVSRVLGEYCSEREQHGLTLILVTSSEVFEEHFPELTCSRVIATARQFRNDISNETVEEEDYLEESQKLYQWLVKPLLQKMDGNSEVNNFVFVMDEGLRDLPLAALHNGNNYLIEDGYSFGLIPSISMTDLNYRNLKDAQILPMGISNFDRFNFLANLPAVPFEITNMIELWGNSRAPIFEEAVTVENLQNERNDYPYEIVHLATHAEIERDSAQSSYIQFGDRKLYLPDVGKIGIGNRPIELLVLSACEIALDSRNAELGFSGLAHQAGVRSILASLWNVSDTGTAALITAFYAELSSMSETTIKAEALRKAQVAMLKGEVSLDSEMLAWAGGESSLPEQVRAALIKTPIDDLSHPVYWAGLTIVGNPW